MNELILILEIIFFAFTIFFIIIATDFMKKTISQREDQIAQMDRFIELYKNINGPNHIHKRSE